MEKVAIVGMGTMGTAIADRLQEKYEVIGITRKDSLEQVHDADAVILAVKPQTFIEEKLYNRLWPLGNKLVVSAMAGIKARRLRRLLGTERVVRTMPNLAVSTGNSLTAWYADDKHVDASAVEELLHTWGSTIRLTDEAQFSAFTALAGSGPAYFFELGRIIEQDALARGFSADQARLIATQTFLGAASVVTTQTSFAGQVTKVASRGGTTEAALSVLADKGFEQTMHQAIGAACNRSQELGASLSQRF